MLIFLFACAPSVVTPPPAEPTAVPTAAVAADWTRWGTPFAVPDTAVIPAATFLADAGAHVGKVVRIEGRVADVCQKAGCWMVVAEGDKTLRVRMKDHAFSVAKDGAGCTASIEGAVLEVAVDPKTVEHYASEAKDPSVIPEKAGGRIFEIEATGVAMKRS